MLGVICYGDSSAGNPGHPGVLATDSPTDRATDSTAAGCGATATRPVAESQRSPPPALNRNKIAGLHSVEGDSPL